MIESTPRPNDNPSIFTTLRSAPVTAGIIVTCLAVWIWAEQHGDTTTTETLLQFGATERSHVWTGEVWRLFTAMFLHIGAIHLLWNMYCMYGWNVPMERQLGKARFLTLYLGSGLVASAVSVLCHDVVAAGASGAGFGVVGAWFVARYRALGSVGAMFRDPWTKRNMGMAALWMLLGFTAISMDNFAHLGGLIAGIALALVLTSARESRLHRARFAVYAVLAAITLAAAFPPPWADLERFAWVTGEAAYETHDPTAVIALADRHPDNESWQRGVRPWVATALLDKRDFVGARAAGEQLIRDRSDDPHGYRVLAQACLYAGDGACALKASLEATKQFPEDLEFWTWVADAQIVSGDPTAALAALDMANGKGDPAYIGRLKVSALFQARRFEEAALALSQHEGLLSEATNTWYQCAVVARTEPLKARPSCEAARARFPDDAEIKLALALVAFASHDFEKAMSELRDAEEIRPSTDAAEHLAVRACVFLARGNRDEAAHDAERALERFPGWALPKAILQAARSEQRVETINLQKLDGSEALAADERSLLAEALRSSATHPASLRRRAPNTPASPSR